MGKINGTLCASLGEEHINVTHAHTNNILDAYRHAWARMGRCLATTHDARIRVEVEFRTHNVQGRFWALPYALRMYDTRRMNWTLRAMPWNASRPFSMLVHAHKIEGSIEILDARVGLSSFVLRRIGQSTLLGGLLFVVV